MSDQGSPQRRHTIIVSDVHLSQAHTDDDNDPYWMRYRRSMFHPDQEVMCLVDRLLAQCDGEGIEFVCNGDVFDFDAPLVADGEHAELEYPTDEPGCAAHIRRILRDHPVFVDALGKLMANGHRLMFLSGNHDVELCFEAVRRSLREVLVEAAMRQGGVSNETELAALVRFRTWFYRSDDGIYIEHGSQYDMINGMPDPMAPIARDGRVQPVCGKLAFKRLGARMGYFNPYCEDTFYMGGLGYIRHFAEHYMFSERHIFRVWAVESVRSSWDIFRNRRGEYHTLPQESLERAHAETGVSREAILETFALRVTPAEKLMLPVLRELWLDRVVLVGGALMVLGLVGLLGSVRQAGIALGIYLVLFLLYELLIPKPDTRTYDTPPAEVRRLYAIHNVRAVCMGHTHRPLANWSDGQFWGNSGTWCPAFYDRECTKPVLDGRPFLWLVARGDDLSGGLRWLRNGVIAPEIANAPSHGQSAHPEADRSEP
jgi:UDP-2,3-diacylglucosamine pyrophosphatase LpxH